MDGKILETLTFPIPSTELLYSPIMSIIFKNFEKSIADNFTGNNSSHIQNFTTYDDLANGLNIAVKIGTIEPLATILYSFLPGGTVNNWDDFKKFLEPYYKRLHILEKELSENLSFEVQVIDDLLGNTILGSGKILLLNKKELVPYKYSVNFENEKSVVFEKYNRLQTQNLDEAVKKVHELNLIESIINVRSKKSYSINATILPFFAYSLI